MSPSPSTGRRIALVGTFHPYRGGIAHFLETVYAGLRARGHEVSAVTFTRQYPERLFPGRTQLEQDDVDDPIGAVRLLDTIDPRSWYRTASHLTRWRAECVLFKYWMPFFAPSCGVIARRVRARGAKVIAIVDNAIPHERRPLNDSLSRYFLRACDGHVVLSEAVARDLDTLGVHAPRRRVQHPTYDIFGDPIPRGEARRRLGLDPDAPVMLFFGFIRRYKGLHVLLEALPAVVRDVPAAQLVVAGEFYESEEPYRQRVRELGLEAHVRMSGEYVATEEVARLFSAADVVVQPYVTATQSGVAQIAYQFDTPTIVTDVGGLAEIVPHERAGLVVPPNDPDALAAAVTRFFREDMSEQLVAGVRAEKPRFSWDPLYEAIESLMAEAGVT